MKTIRCAFLSMAVAVIAIAVQSCQKSAEEIQAEKVAAVIHANDELFNKGNLDYADELFAADYHGGGPGMIKAFVSARRIAFPDLQVKIDPVISDGEMVAWLRTSTGTQRGDYWGRRPTNKKITWKEMVFTKYNDEGKIAQEWSVSDMREMLSVARDIDGLYEYLPPTKGQGVNQNGRFLYLSGPVDGKSPMTSHGGMQVISGDTIKNYIEFSTNPKQVGTMYMWRVTTWSADTAFYELMDANGKVTGNGKALRIAK